MKHYIFAKCRLLSARTYSKKAAMSCMSKPKDIYFPSKRAIRRLDKYIFLYQFAPISSPPEIYLQTPLNNLKNNLLHVDVYIVYVVCKVMKLMVLF